MGQCDEYVTLQGIEIKGRRKKFHLQGPELIYKDLRCIVRPESQMLIFVADSELAPELPAWAVNAILLCRYDTEAPIHMVASRDHGERVWLFRPTIRRRKFGRYSNAIYDYIS